MKLNMPSYKVPCKVGETIYYIGTERNGVYTKPLSCMVTNLRWNNRGNEVKRVDSYIFTVPGKVEGGMSFLPCEFGKFVFRTYPEANQAYIKHINKMKKD